MPTLQEIRTAIRDTIAANVPEIVGYRTVPDVRQVPAFVVEPDEANYLVAGGNCSRWQFCVYVFVARTETNYAQDVLDAFISANGTSSIPAVVKANPFMLDGVQVVLKGMDGYGGHYSAASIPHVGARLKLDVLITE